MAKINAVIVPKASGSIGNITFRTSGRVTVASEKITKNPSRTAAQVEQRDIFYSAMEVAKRYKMAARYLYSRKNFKTSFSQLSSIVLRNTDSIIGNFDFKSAAEAGNKQMVPGDVLATYVSCANQNTTQEGKLFFRCRIPKYGVSERVDHTYSVTELALVHNGGTTIDEMAVDTCYPLAISQAELEEDGEELLLDITCNIQDVAALTWSDTNFYFPCFRINGTKIGYMPKVVDWSQTA